VEGLVLEKHAVAEAAGDHHDVGALDFIDRSVRHQREGVRLVPDFSGLLGDEDRLVAGHGVEDVVRSGDVEGREAVVEQVGDLHRCSPLSAGPPLRASA
jgi:hypothetical protein